jgi:hypothetical protein
VVRLGNQLRFEESLAALPVQLSLVQVGLPLRQSGLGGLQRGGRCLDRVGRSVDACGLGLHIRGGLNAFQVQQDIALLYVVPFLHIDFRYLSDSLTQHVGVGLRAHFARCGNDGGYVLPRRFAGLNCHNSLMCLLDADDNGDQQNQCYCNPDQGFFPGLHYRVVLLEEGSAAGATASHVYTVQANQMFPGVSPSGIRRADQIMAKTALRGLSGDIPAALNLCIPFPSIVTSLGSE